ncbi:ABC transporter ATP-binding protein [Nonomuraea cypriaca]|uniref:ABC transporter ATP-binding protein n=1 Tax=Nonomuraea cypriaca TaxID=1187855 RepID=UPI002E2D10BE|nr:ABC transporter ATP-binding protein [Nonomuraea cypriaca]
MNQAGGPALKLEARGLHKHFIKRGQPLEVLRDINFGIAPGEFVAVVGASGCGKTTLLRMADGLESISAGSLLIDGQERTDPGPDRGFVFQQDTLMPWRTVLKNIALGLELQGKPKRAGLEQARRFLEVVGLAGFEQHYPHELSGGMRQRANLARAFCIEPELLLMDEPFAALDAQTREIMQSELLRIWERTAGGTVLFITHQIDEAIFLADRIIVLTARPGRMKDIIDVPFARPRDLEVKRTAEFGALYDHIWKMIEEEVRVSMGMRSG